MSSIIRLGLAPKATSTVSDSLRKKGIDLLKAMPSDINYQVLPTFDYPLSYSLYRTSIHAFVRAAETNTTVSMNDPYMLFTSTEVPVYAPLPTINFNFASPIADTERDSLLEMGCFDSVIRGKASMVIEEATRERVARIVSDANPIQITPGSPTAINIAAYKQFLLLHRLFYTLVRTQQYPNSDVDRKFKDIIEIDEVSFDKVDHAAVDEDVSNSGYKTNYTQEIPQSAWTQFYLASNPSMKAHCNLVVRHAAYFPIVQSANQLPDYPGFLCPFVLDLSLPDRSIPIDIINRYFLGCLGDTEREAADAFNRLKASWGVLAITPWGMELAHMYWCLGYMMLTGCTIRVITSSVDKYMGCALLGDGYALQLDDSLIHPASVEKMREDFSAASPHDAAVSVIFNKIFFTDNEKRAEAKMTCTSIHDLRKVLAKQGTSELGRREIEKNAAFLDYANDFRPLPITGANISKILQIIAETTMDESLVYLHHSEIMNPSRTERLWSAFGPLAPSFRVPAGKKMELSGSFEVTERSSKGAKTSRIVKKIGFILKPLAEAILDLEAVKRDKFILNPHGTALMGRVSAQSLIRTVEGEQCTSVLAALRSFAQVTVAEASSSKRKLDDEGEERGSKKRRADDF